MSLLVAEERCIEKGLEQIPVAGLLRVRRLLVLKSKKLLVGTGAIVEQNTYVDRKTGTEKIVPGG